MPPADTGLRRYFVNDDDEIRTMADPDYYFKFFLDLNERINARQRFAFSRKLPRGGRERG